LQLLLIAFLSSYLWLQKESDMDEDP